MPRRAIEPLQRRNPEKTAHRQCRLIPACLLPPFLLRPCCHRRLSPLPPTAPNVFRRSLSLDIGSRAAANGKHHLYQFCCMVLISDGPTPSYGFVVLWPCGRST
ncbi:hypothetical protein CGRA01v4_11544 [Colletotrichum graminicola]|nr:hypothetical protein CGRA01v4_11544 [Colletotrichum graminicola]